MAPSNTSLPLYLTFSLHTCMISTFGIFTSTAMIIIDIFGLLPLCILILYLGFQRWQQRQRSNMTMSHSDLFTYHTVILELVSVIGFTLISCGAQTDRPQLEEIGFYLYMINFSGQTTFHILTCVERYLAVVHPVTYLTLRKEKGIRIRNITIGFVWLLSIAGPTLSYVPCIIIPTIIYFTAIAFAIIVVSFCSFSVLRVLARPRPGEGSGSRQQVDQSKLKAFYTIMAILGTLLFRFMGNILSSSLSTTPQLAENVACAGWFSFLWICLPSSLVLPLLFLQRAGKLLCCNNKDEPGQGSH